MRRSTPAAPPPSATSPAPRPRSTSRPGRQEPATPDGLPAAREVVLHAHFDATLDGLATVFGPTGRMEEGQRLVLLDQVKDWCADSRTKVTVKPVIDLNADLATPAYEVPDRIREQVILRDRTCVFPWCTRPARGCDIDHVTPHDPDADAEGTTTARSHPDRQPRRPVPVPPPPQDPHRLALPDDRARGLRVDLTARPPLPTRPTRHHRDRASRATRPARHPATPPTMTPPRTPPRLGAGGGARHARGDAQDRSTSTIAASGSPDVATTSATARRAAASQATPAGHVLPVRCSREETRRRRDGPTPLVARRRSSRLSRVRSGSSEDVVEQVDEVREVAGAAAEEGDGRPWSATSSRTRRTSQRWCSCRAVSVGRPVAGSPG